MAQATRPISPTVPLSDDPVENATMWLDQRKKPILYGVGGVLVVAALIWGYRAMDASKRNDAAQALYRAQTQAASGDPVRADSALMRVAKNYGGTAAGRQALMLAAQLRFDQGFYDLAIKSLQDASGSGDDEFKTSAAELIAAGYEGKTSFDSAATYYAKAAETARFDRKRGELKAAQARVLMAAKKPAESAKVWQELAQQEQFGFAQEAQVRLGEIVGTGTALPAAKP